MIFLINVIFYTFPKKRWLYLYVVGKVQVAIVCFISMLGAAMELTLVYSSSESSYRSSSDSDVKFRGKDWHMHRPCSSTPCSPGTKSTTQEWLIRPTGPI